MSFKCIENCNADCCGLVPIKKTVYRKHLSDRCQPVIEELKIDDLVIPVTENGTCCFLDITAKCNIYKDRPKLCKDYGTHRRQPCPYVQINGVPRTPTETIKTKDWIEKFVDNVLAKKGLKLIK